MLRLSFSPKFKHDVFVTCSDICCFFQQKEEGKVQGQLNHTDSSQYIRDLKDQIAELKHEVRLLKQREALGCFSLCKDSDFVVFLIFDLFQHLLSDMVLLWS